MIPSITTRPLRRSWLPWTALAMALPALAQPPAGSGAAEAAAKLAPRPAQAPAAHAPAAEATRPGATGQADGAPAASAKAQAPALVIKTKSSPP